MSQDEVSSEGSPTTEPVETRVYAVGMLRRYVDDVRLEMQRVSWPTWRQVRSTTLVVQVETLAEGPELVLSGPGIRGTSTLRVGALPSDFAARMQANRDSFPLGIDLLLVCGAQLVALPRSTHVAIKEKS